MEEDEWLALKKKKAEISLPRKLDDLSIGELNDYLPLLEEEAARVKAMITRKQAAQSAAEAIFKKTGE